MWSKASTKRKTPGRTLYAVLALLLLVGVTVAVGSRSALWAGPFDLPKGNDPIIGDLGGETVSVPLNYTHLITEYDGDPSVFDPERRKWKPPVRTFTSKINSLPLMVHLPDFAPRTAENESSYFKTPAIDDPHEWLPVGVTASSQFFISDDALKEGSPFNREKIIESHSGPTNPKFGGPAFVRYDKEDTLRYGLATPPGSSHAKRAPP
ncbi:hypothetical protein [Cupriavidus sp. IK-TO18]|uniref:hypothetical protein n=1 Tax=Cupriavidus sp. IK-TO18 TaxID=2782182 RepID=UPI001898EED1|nr:hypothetical protein [Cupriavidus sp. IK-TO18]MBF6992612.1 hypothetical protein [Cupriavidus sp. IK-TO18]